MRIDWVPYSGSALVVGATALSVGALLTPRADGTGGLAVLVEGDPQRWLAVVVLYLVAAVGLVLGLPAVLSIFDVRGVRTALVGVALFAVGCLGTVAYAVLLAIYRAMVLSGHTTGTVEDLARDAGLMPVLFTWVGTFLLGEVLLGVALLQGRRVPRWVPLLLLAHAGLALVAPLLPDPLRAAVALLVSVALAALGIFASQNRLQAALWSGGAR